MKFYFVCALDYKHLKLNSIAIGLNMDFWQIFVFSGKIEIFQKYLKIKMRISQKFDPIEQNGF